MGHDKRRVTCTNHCSVCDGHFHSEAAFTAHRHRGACLEPGDDERFGALAEDGVCRLGRYPYVPLGDDDVRHEVYPAGWVKGDPPVQRKREPVTVWTLAANLERAGGWQTVRRWMPSEQADREAVPSR
jgi:hypothetical protein